ncbi:prepilin-type N-terminal cleavage/methylation domain-containing protein [Vibrio sp. CAIM 722]|uniref:Prepilin-type N-terminal cleavage/methylation domain-containing protein n=1 Tax=Vibrio eleionomae TaxID=2653505 RepID=A0A7X4LIY7_9VIBR|nr:prepilin-type N-terminal cleavage/methylation domain-containing protein [Vibrio eleionomae]MZI92726.1 prepilin-type N-terminal cleavage/methylation domain-containing protein [Vibrio eleionomae]
MRRRGFTLIEMIMTIIIGSILVLGIAGFLELGAKGYTDTVARQRIQTQAQFVLEKIAREIRHAVPNSIAVTDNSNGQCVSFYPIKYAGFYGINEQSQTLQFIVGDAPSSYDGLSLIINPSRQSDFTDNSIYFSLSGSDTTLSLTANHVLLSTSIADRAYLYQNSVEYCLNLTTNALTRNNVQVGDSISRGTMSYEAPTLHRGGVVRISLTFAQNGEQSHFEQDVQVLNVP